MNSITYPQLIEKLIVCYCPLIQYKYALSSCQNSDRTSGQCRYFLYVFATIQSGFKPDRKNVVKMKAILRKSKIRVASELPEAVKAALKTISAMIAKGGFTHVVFALIKRIAIIPQST